jgi:hypothetical protein
MKSMVLMLLDMWKNIAKRDKHNFDYLTAIDVFNRLHKHYQFVYVENWNLKNLKT